MNNVERLSNLIEDIIDNRGKNPPYYTDNGIPVIDNYLIGERLYPDVNLVTRFIDENLYNTFIRCKTQKNDLLITLVGNGYGNVCLCNENQIIIQNTIALRFKKNAEQSYFYYYFKQGNIKKWLQNLDRGSAQPNIKVGDLLRMKIDLPNLFRQQRIAEVLNNYDQLIENNNQRIKILEDMAESLYKEWFVRFRHPIYKPSIGKVKNLCMIKSGFAFKSSDWIDNGVKVVKIKDINGNYVDSKSLDCVPIEVAKKAFRFQLNVGDLTIAMTGATIGKVGLVKDNGLYTNQRVGKFFVDKKHVPFLYCFFKQEHIVETIASISSSSAAQPNISGEDLENIDMPFNIELINEFSDKVSSMFNDMIRLLNINELLLTQRDALLPRLMSGKLEVARGAN